MDKRLLMPVLLACAACMPVAPQLDSRFGASVRGLRAQQALPPRPAASGGVDAAATQGALARYRQSYQAASPPPAPRAFFSAAGGHAAD